MKSIISTPMHYVYDGRECVGFVLARGRKGHEALDREQRSLGLSKTAAAAAIRILNPGISIAATTANSSRRSRHQVHQIVG